MSTPSSYILTVMITAGITLMSWEVGTNILCYVLFPIPDYSLFIPNAIPQ